MFLTFWAFVVQMGAYESTCFSCLKNLKYHTMVMFIMTYAKSIICSLHKSYKTLILKRASALNLIKGVYQKQTNAIYCFFDTKKGNRLCVLYMYSWVICKQNNILVSRDSHCEAYRFIDRVLESICVYTSTYKSQMRRALKDLYKFIFIFGKEILHIYYTRKAVSDTIDQVVNYCENKLFGSFRGV